MGHTTAQHANARHFDLLRRHPHPEAVKTSWNDGGGMQLHFREWARDVGTMNYAAWRQACQSGGFLSSHGVHVPARRPVRTARVDLLNRPVLARLAAWACRTIGILAH